MRASDEYRTRRPKRKFLRVDLYQNKAARDDKNRVGHMLGPKYRRIALGSALFTGSALSLLRRHAELVGLKIETYSFLDTDDQLRLPQQLIKAARPLMNKRGPRAANLRGDLWLENRAR